MFRRDDGKNSSLAWNMLGVNWVFRDEDAVLFALLLPNSLLKSNPQIVESVQQRIVDMKQHFRKRGGSATKEEGEALAAWIDETHFVGQDKS